MNNMRQLFPWFSVNSDCIYFDNAATAHKPVTVIDAVAGFYAKQNATVHRGLYDAAEGATTAYELVRVQLQHFINARYMQEIVFTSGTTAGINQWALMVAGRLQPGDEILITQVEHHANLIPWQQVAQKTGAVLKFFPLNHATFSIDSSAVTLLTPKTKIVAIAHESNVLGNIWNNGQLEQIIDVAHTYGALVLLDVAASIAHQRIDVQALPVDALVFSGHKMLGPTGIGVLYIKKELGAQLAPVFFGGSMVYSVSYEATQFAKIPHLFEAGTPPIAEVIGLGAAINFYREHISYSELQQHEAALCQQLITGLEQINGVCILGNKNQLVQNGHLVTFTVAGVHAHDLAAFLNQQGIMVRAGHHCAQPLATLLSVTASVRVSFLLYNTRAEVTQFLDCLRKAVAHLRGL